MAEGTVAVVGGGPAGLAAAVGLRRRGWSDSAGGDLALELTGPGGRSTFTPAAVVLATGCRERPRSARLIPGSRPAGVMTTGMVQQLVYLRGLPAGGGAPRGG